MKKANEMKVESFESNPTRETKRTAATELGGRQQSAGLKVKTGLKAGPVPPGQINSI